MADVRELLDGMDDLRGRLDQALDDQDWDRLNELAGQVREVVEPVMSALEQGQVSATEVRERLEALNRFVEVANESAEKARDEARRELQGMNQNRSAARAYQDMSGGRRK